MNLGEEREPGEFGKKHNIVHHVSLKMSLTDSLKAMAFYASRKENSNANVK